MNVVDCIPHCEGQIPDLPIFIFFIFNATHTSYARTASARKPTSSHLFTALSSGDSLTARMLGGTSHSVHMVDILVSNPLRPTTPSLPQYIAPTT